MAENDPGAAAAAAEAAKAASDKAAADKAAADKAAADAVAATAAQTVPLERFQAVVGQRAEAQRANEALTRELKLANDTIEEFKALGQKTASTEGTKTAATVKTPTPAELQALVREEASKQNFDQRCNEAALAGRAAHSDFDKIVLGDLTSVSPVLDRNTGRPVLPVPLLEAALETGNAPEVLYALGKDISEASRIMALRPVAQGVELAKFSAKLAAAKTTESTENDELDEDGKAKLANVSRAPAPIKAPTKAGATKPAFTIYDTENFSTEEWIRQREKQVADNRANPRR